MAQLYLNIPVIWATNPVRDELLPQSPCAFTDRRDRICGLAGNIQSLRVSGIRRRGEDADAEVSQ